MVVSGDLSRLPEELVLKINKAETATVSNRVMTLNLCINYGGRAELAHAVNEIIRSGKTRFRKRNWENLCIRICLTQTSLYGRADRCV